MRRLRPALLALVLFAPTSGCGNSPTEEECKRAVANMQRIYEIDPSAQAAETMAFVRKCRAQSTKQSVTCIIQAKTEAEIDACTK